MFKRGAMSMHGKLVHRWGAAIVVVVLLTAALAATAATAATSSQKAKGQPIKFGFSTALTATNINVPDPYYAVRAAVKSINAHGGVTKDHRPLQLVFCDYKNQPTEAANCGRQFADDPSIVATAGDNVVYGEQYAPPLIAAKVARLGDLATSTPDLTGNNSFPTAGGTFISFAGNAQQVLLHNFKKPVIIHIDLTQVQIVLAALDAVLKPKGVNLEKVPLSATAVDVTAAVTKALDFNPDVVLIALADPQLSLVVQQVYQQSGGKIPIITSFSQYGQTKLKAFGPAANVLIGDTYFPPYSAKSVQGVKMFNSDLDKYAPKKTERTDLAMNSWLGVYLLKDVLAHITTYDRASVFQYMNTLSNWTGSFGLTPPLDFTKPAPGPVPIPRLFNSYAVYSTVKKGQIVPDSKKGSGLSNVFPNAG